MKEKGIVYPIMKVIEAIKHPSEVIFAIGMRGGFRFLSDETYLKFMFRCKMGKKLNLANPQTFNEKLQWLKLKNRNPLYTSLVDKYEVKKYVANVIGDEYIIPTIGVWDSFDEINFGSLPDQFVLKCTHDSGGVVICNDKSQFDVINARKQINKALRRNYYWGAREWPYKDVKPRIIAEKYLVDESGYELKDYKFFCFDGIAKAMYVASDREIPNEPTKFDFYDMNFCHLPIKNGHPNSKKRIAKPQAFDEMRILAERIATDIPHVRVDFYDINGKVYFGEITFFHMSGMTPFEPSEWDEKFGEWINLPE